MSELNPGSRMQKRGVGDLQHPAQCAVCGNGSCEAGYIDIGVWYEYEGQVYLCMFCVNELIDSAGLLNEAEQKFICQQNDQLAQAHKELTESLEVANAKLHHYDALFSDRFNNHPDIASDLVNAQKPSESANESVDDGEVEESVTPEPVVSEGLPDVSRIEQPNGLDL